MQRRQLGARWVGDAEGLSDAEWVLSAMAGWAAAELPDAYGRSPSRFALGGFRAGRLDCIALVGRQ